jgi:hypothetical protein
MGGQPRRPAAVGRPTSSSRTPWVSSATDGIDSLAASSHANRLPFALRTRAGSTQKPPARVEAQMTRSFIRLTCRLLCSSVPQLSHGRFFCSHRWSTLGHFSGLLNGFCYIYSTPLFYYTFRLHISTLFNQHDLMFDVKVRWRFKTVSGKSVLSSDRLCPICVLVFCGGLSDPSI